MSVDGVDGMKRRKEGKKRSRKKVEEEILSRAKSKKRRHRALRPTCLNHSLDTECPLCDSQDMAIFSLC